MSAPVNYRRCPDPDLLDPEQDDRDALVHSDPRDLAHVGSNELFEARWARMHRESLHSTGAYSHAEQVAR